MGVQCSEVLVDGGVASGSTTPNRLQASTHWRPQASINPRDGVATPELSCGLQCEIIAPYLYVSQCFGARGENATEVKMRLRAMCGIASDESAGLARREDRHAVQRQAAPAPRCASGGVGGCQVSQ